MSPLQNRLERISELEIPQLYEQFSRTSLTLLERAHNSDFELPNGSFNLFNDPRAHRAYFERNNSTPWHDYDLLAIHLGNASLTVSIEHHHPAQPPQRYATSSLVFEPRQVTAYHTKRAGFGTSETVTDDTQTAEYMTRQLQHTMGEIGLQARI